MLAPARVGQEEARKRRAPILQYQDQCAVREMRSGLLFRHEGETDAVDRRPREQPDVIRDQRPVNRDDDGLIALVQFPTVNLSLNHAGS